MKDGRPDWLRAAGPTRGSRIGAVVALLLAVWFVGGRLYTDACSESEPESESVDSISKPDSGCEIYYLWLSDLRTLVV
jgi:hypothetical protein